MEDSSLIVAVVLNVVAALVAAVGLTLVNNWSFPEARNEPFSYNEARLQPVCLAVLSLPIAYFLRCLSILFLEPCPRSGEYDSSAKIALALSGMSEYFLSSFLVSVWPFVFLGVFVITRANWGRRGQIDTSYDRWATTGAVIGLWFPYVLFTVAQPLDTTRFVFACTPPPHVAGGDYGWGLVAGIGLLPPVGAITTTIGWFSGRLAFELWYGLPARKALHSLLVILMILASVLWFISMLLLR
jgi:hypothetical protein